MADRKGKQVNRAIEVKSEEKPETPILSKYNRDCHKNTEFFTTYPADLVFDEIMEILYEHF
jgi:hypothetical protein